MNLADELLSLIPGTPRVVAFVGAGGKTSALFRLALELERKGRSVLVTTTTRLADPGRMEGGAAGRIVFRPEMEFPGSSLSSPTALPVPEGRSRPGTTTLLSRSADEPGKVKGVHPSWVTGLKAAWDFVLVEADGSKRLPVKAPASYEPVVPPGSDLVVGLIGLDCLGMPMDGRTVHRPELFARVTGCGPGAPIAWEHLAALSRHPEGLFKGVEAPRAVLLNKADLAPFRPSRAQLGELAADLALVCSLEGRE